MLGASSVICQTRIKAREGWLADLIGRRPTMVAAVAQANKTARVAWALLARGESYRPRQGTLQPAGA